ncbi:MAG: hypothetical protein ACLPQY_05090 [Streptosporangiaceae bacterium]
MVAPGPELEDDRVGAMTQATYDYLGRKLTSTDVERYPSDASYSTSYAYGNGGWLSRQTPRSTRARRTRPSPRPTTPTASR